MSEPKAEYKTRKKSAFVVNAFQTPNAYVDEIMPHLSGEEWKVLTYATRRILGFQKRQDRISISQFTDGTKNQDGEVLDSGTGLGIETVKNCLANLVSFGLMVRLQENDYKTNEGILWGLQWNSEKVNWEAIEARETKRTEANKKRIAKARSVRQTHPSGTERTHPSGTERGGASGTETQKTVERKRKKVKEATPPAPTPPEIKLYHSVVKRYPNTEVYPVVVNAIQKISVRLSRACTAEDLKPYFDKWLTKSSNRANFSVWLEEWAVVGKLPQQGTPQKKSNFERTVEGLQKFLSNHPEEVFNG